jgi:hypothetical protein
VGLAAVDALTGALEDWNPGLTGAVRALDRYGSILFVGGDFLEAGGEARERLAAFDLDTGDLTAWNPGADATVRALAGVDSKLYVGGDFTTLGGTPRSFLGAVHATTGQIDPWNPGADADVLALALSPDAVYVGGAFTDIGGAARNRIAALDYGTGLATSWNPNANREVHALAWSGGHVYAGGEFWNIGGETRVYVADLSAYSGRALPWAPIPGGTIGSCVYGLAVGPEAVYVGGSCWYMADSMASFLGAAVLTGVGVPEIPTAASPLRVENLPNPFNPRTTIRFDLPRAMPYTLCIYSPAGRLVERIEGEGAAGINDVVWDVRDRALASGVYLCRVTAGALHDGRSMVLVK